MNIIILLVFNILLFNQSLGTLSRSSRNASAATTNGAAVTKRGGISDQPQDEEILPILPLLWQYPKLNLDLDKDTYKKLLDKVKSICERIRRDNKSKYIQFPTSELPDLFKDDNFPPNIGFIRGILDNLLAYRLTSEVLTPYKNDDSKKVQPIPADLNALLEAILCFMNGDSKEVHTITADLNELIMALSCLTASLEEGADVTKLMTKLENKNEEWRNLDSIHLASHLMHWSQFSIDTALMDLYYQERPNYDQKIQEMIDNVVESVQKVFVGKKYNKWSPADMIASKNYIIWRINISRSDKDNIDVENKGPKAFRDLLIHCAALRILYVNKDDSISTFYAETLCLRLMETLYRVEDASHVMSDQQDATTLDRIQKSMDRVTEHAEQAAPKEEESTHDAEEFFKKRKEQLVKECEKESERELKLKIYLKERRDAKVQLQNRVMDLGAIDEADDSTARKLVTRRLEIHLQQANTRQQPLDWSDFDVDDSVSQDPHTATGLGAENLNDLQRTLTLWKRIIRSPSEQEDGLITGEIIDELMSDQHQKQSSHFEQEATKTTKKSIKEIEGRIKVLVKKANGHCKFLYFTESIKGLDVPTDFMHVHDLGFQINLQRFHYSDSLLEHMQKDLKEWEDKLNMNYTQVMEVSQKLTQEVNTSHLIRNQTIKPQEMEKLKNMEKLLREITAKLIPQTESLEQLNNELKSSQDRLNNDPLNKTLEELKNKRHWIELFKMKLKHLKTDKETAEKVIEGLDNQIEATRNEINEIKKESLIEALDLLLKELSTLNSEIKHERNFLRLHSKMARLRMLQEKLKTNDPEVFKEFAEEINAVVLWKWQKSTPMHFEILDAQIRMTRFDEVTAELKKLEEEFMCKIIQK
eukprot:GHVL01027215.1.p1 GENE.GHVL01027215.1~~GHVL01027215.1.p1  ORF type:complete len:871 (+),score=154.83 GHVL01027215.1:26-2638(+)